MMSQTSPGSESLPGPSRPDPAGSGLRAHLAFATVLVATCAMVLESAAVSVALPVIARDLSVSDAKATWVMGISQFIIVALLLPMASLAETVGFRRFYLAMLLTFSIATIACIAAPDFNSLVTARGLQSVGTAGAMSVSFAMARTIYADKELGRSIGLLATTVALASSGGPAISGVLLEYSGWRAVFALMLGFSAVAYAGGQMLLPENCPSERRFDLGSSVLVATTLSCLLYVLNGLANGWQVWSLALAGVAAASGFIVLHRVSSGKAGAVFPLDLLALPVFSLSILASICVFAAQSLGFVLLPFYLLNGAGLSPIAMAAVLSIWPLTTAILAPFLGWISDRTPAGPVGAAGLVIYAIGFFLLAALPSSAGAADIAVRLALCGFGFAVFQTPNNRLVMLAAPRERSGAASGMISLARQLGRAAGTAMAAFALAADPDPGALGMLNLAGGLALLGALASFGRQWTATPGGRGHL